MCRLLLIVFCLVIISQQVHLEEISEAAESDHRLDNNGPFAWARQELNEFVENKEKQLQGLFELSYNKALLIAGEMKNNFEKVIVKIKEYTDRANSEEEKSCLREKQKEVVELVGEYYRKPPSPAYNVKLTLENAKIKIVELHNGFIKNIVVLEVKYAKCAQVEEETDSNCKSGVIEKAKQTLTKIIETIEDIYVETKQVIDEALKIVEDWQDNQDLSTFERAMALLDETEICLMDNKERDEL